MINKKHLVLLASAGAIFPQSVQAARNVEIRVRAHVAVINVRIVTHLLGQDGDFGEAMGLSSDWAYQIVKQVGNYADIYDRNVGADSDFNIARGLNALWKDGGIQYAPPIR